MTIIFGYYYPYTYESFVLGVIPSIILAIFSVILNYFIIKSSKTQSEQKERPYLLYYIGIINIIFIIIPFVVPTFSIVSPTDIEEMISVSYFILLGLIKSLPFFITYGILFFRFGKLNESRYKRYLKICGILWMISNGVNTVVLNSELFTVISFLTDYNLSIDVFLWLFIIIGLISILDLIGWVILIVHSVKNKDNNLLIAGILRLIAFVVIMVYNSIMPLLI
jgi:heme exporter protein D